MSVVFQHAVAELNGHMLLSGIPIILNGKGEMIINGEQKLLITTPAGYFKAVPSETRSDFSQNFSFMPRINRSSPLQIPNRPTGYLHFIARAKNLHYLHG